MHIPRPSSLFVGREQELQRVEHLLEEIPTALVCGVAGVGKSAFLYALAARVRRPVIYGRATVGLTELIDDCRRACAGGAVPELADDEARLVDVAERLDTLGALWAVDDVHALAPAARELLFDTLGARLRTGRFVATARELVARSPGARDRIELRLTGLDRAAAQALWARLDELHGAWGEFDAAWQRSRGSPFHLRRAHVAELEWDDPLAHAIDALDANERVVAGALAISTSPLPGSLVRQLLGDGDARAAVRRLVADLIVDIDCHKACIIHDLFRELILARLTAHERASLHARLAHLLAAAADVDPIVRAREVCRHLRACDRHEEAGQYLVENGAVLVQSGAASELFRALERIPAHLRSVDVQITRARVLIRLLQPQRAYDELRDLVASHPAAPPDLAAVHANAALMIGELDVGRRLIAPVLASSENDPWAALRAHVLLAICATLQGDGAGARARLATAADALGVASLRAVIGVAQAFSAWLDEDDAEGLAFARRAEEVLRAGDIVYRGNFLAPALLACLFARNGRLTEAEETLARATRFARQDPRMRLILQAVRATVQYERGDWAPAIAGFRAAVDAWEAGGEVSGATWATAWLGRALIMVGQRRAGERLLDDALRTASAMGAVALARAAERGRAGDPAAQLRASGESAPPTSPRSHLYAALRAAARGQAELAARLLAGAGPLPDAPEHGLDRALAAITRATSARIRGDAREADAELAAARHHASTTDPEVLRDLLEVVSELQDVTNVANERPRGGCEPHADLGAYDAILDGSRHELRTREGAVSLKTRPVLRKLLYTLARRPAKRVGKAALAESLWAARYRAPVHDAALWTNVKRLRRLLEGCGLEIDGDAEGYSLRAPAQFLFIDAPDR